MPAPSPKTDRLREMREERHEERLRQTPGERIIEALEEAVEIAQGKRVPARTYTVTVPAKPKAEIVAEVKKLVSNPTLANMANSKTTYKHRDADARRAYQRDLMRKKRAEGKKAT